MLISSFFYVHCAEFVGYDVEQTDPDGHYFPAKMETCIKPFHTKVGNFFVKTYFFVNGFSVNY